MKRKLNYFIFALLFVGILTVKCDVVEAATTYTDTLPDTVTVGSISCAFKTGTDASNTSISNYPFLALSQDGNYQLYCSDRSKGDLVAATVLSKGERLDYGLAYILMNSYPTKEVVGSVAPKVFANSSYSDYTGSFAYANNMLDVWTTQMAIWGYQGSITSSGLSNSDILRAAEASDQTASLEYYSSFTDATNNSPIYATNLWNTYVNPLITKAKAANTDSPYNAKLSISVDGNWAKIDGTNTSKSGLISVSTSSSASFSTYALSMENAPEGTKVYTEDGTDITNSISAIPATKKVYLVVNRDNVKEDVKFTVKASTTISYNAAYQYIDKTTGHQPSILVGKESKDLSAALEMTLSPDTALSVSNSIYFLGFMILISGVFIIYANVKTKKQNAE